MTGQFLGYLTSAPELVATLFISGTGLFTVVAVNILAFFFQFIHQRMTDEGTLQSGVFVKLHFKGKETDHLIE